MRAAGPHVGSEDQTHPRLYPSAKMPPPEDRRSLRRPDNLLRREHYQFGLTDVELAAGFFGSGWAFVLLFAQQAALVEYKSACMVAPKRLSGNDDIQTIQHRPRLYGAVFPSMGRP